MCFERMYHSLKNDELILADGGMCRWHLRQDGQLTILEILSSIPGTGSKMLDMLMTKPADSIFAKCPADLEANNWYRKKGFIHEGTHTTASGRVLNKWRLHLS